MENVILITDNTTLVEFREIKTDDLVREGDRQEKVIANHIVYDGENGVWDVVLILQSSAKICRTFEDDLSSIESQNALKI